MSRFIQTHFDNKQPNTYHEYMNFPILPLERALAPVSSSVNLLDHRIKRAKSMYRHFSTYKLTEDESTAVFLYTKEWGEQSLHHLLNQALNSGYYALMRPWFGFLKLFNTVLEKLPNVKGLVWRGVHINIVRYYQKNEEITWWNVSSCSFSVGVIRRLLDESSILCSIEALNGKNIRDFADDTTEDEILLLPGTRLRVIDKKLDCSTGQNIVYLKEISNDSPKTPTSTPSSISQTSKSSKHEFKPVDSTTSYVSTAYMPVDNSLSNKNELRNDKVCSITTFSNGAQYETTDKDGKRQDYGIYYDTHGVKYEGYSAYLRASGDGFRILSNGDRYDGTFKHNKMDGYGSVVRANGYEYVGNWTDDEANGKGISNWPNGNHYEGDHEKGKIQGRGTFQSINGNKYEGNLIDGKAHGRGVRIWPNNDRYEGSFENDKKHGYGTYSYSGGGKYEGHWACDEMNGQGSLKWPSGARYEGTFKNGKRHGWGKLIFATGQVQSGHWENDKYIS